MRKIALVGTSESGVEAPYSDESWEIWGVAGRGAHATRATRWFELHRLDGESEDWSKQWRKAIKEFSQDVELYMFYPEPDLGPTVINYPYDRIVDRFGTYFMTSSFAWMMALAIDELRPIGADAVEGEIGIWGVDMEYGTEYRQQRAGFRHFMDVARFANVPVSRFANTGLSFDPVPYPLWQDDPLLNKLDQRQKLSREKVTSYSESIQHTRTMIAQNNAMIEMLRKYPDTEEEVARLEKELESLMSTSGSISKDIVRWTAVEDEQAWLRDYLSP
ncbi:hypothetical protein LCGC14_2533240 [marine sediment metagenome]|uniref:Uncharacterized protein n=1 Tax=marine sediment metagenome TaxID=412755 RepID=A0A0F9ATD5_9ZZZZ